MGFRCESNIFLGRFDLVQRRASARLVWNGLVRIDADGFGDQDESAHSGDGRFLAKR